MKKRWMAGMALAGAMALSGCGNSADVATFKEGKVSQEELYEAMKKPYGESALQQLLVEKILMEKYEVSEEEVEKQLEEVKAQLGDSFESILQQNGINGEEGLKASIASQMAVEMASVKDIKVTDDELKAKYEEFKPEIRASHILVADEKIAKDLKARIDSGEDFAALAKEHSTDTVSAAKGGDLDFFGPGVMVPAFEEAAYKLEVGKVGDPVQTEHGWHIIKLTEKKEKESFDKMKDQLTDDLMKSKVDNSVMQKALLREWKEAGVKVKDADLKGFMESGEEK